MVTRYNSASFRTLAFVMEHDYAGAIEPWALGPQGFQERLEADEYEQIVRIGSIGYERRFVDAIDEYLHGYQDSSVRVEMNGETTLKQRYTLVHARWCDGALVVCEAPDGAGLKRGDRVVALDGVDIEKLVENKHTPTWGDAGGPAHRLWDAVFDRARSATLANGATVEVPKGSRSMERGGNSVERVGRWVVVRVMRPGGELPDNTDAMISDAEGVIIDLRGATSTDLSDNTTARLLPYVVGEETLLKHVEGYGGSYLRCSLNNVRLLSGVVASAAATNTCAPEDARGLHRLADAIRELDGAGSVYVDLERGIVGDDAVVPSWAVDETITPAYLDKPVFVLCDIQTAGAAERLVRTASRFGRAKVVGRPTAGTTDCDLPITVKLDEVYSLTYPAAVGCSAYTGSRINGVGVKPDIEIPWTLEHLERDVDLVIACTC